MTSSATSKRLGLSIQQRLSIIVAAIAVPMLLLSSGVVWRLAEREREISRDAIMYTARSISSAVDAQLGKYLAVAQALAASPSLQVHNLSAFREEAERALPGLSGAWVALADTQGQQVVNTLAAAGEPLPRVAPEVAADGAHAFNTKQMRVSNVAIGPVAKVPVIDVGVPVFRGTDPVYFLMIGVDVTVFRDLLNSQRIPDGWIVGVADRQGHFVARSRDHDSWVARSASSGWRGVMRQEGVSEFQSLEQRQVVNANIVSSLSGWATGVATEKAVIEAPIGRTLLVAGTVAGILTLLGVLLALWMAQGITAPIRMLEENARALQNRRPVTISTTGVPEFDHAMAAFDAASRSLQAHEKALRESEERFRLLVTGIKDCAIYMVDPGGIVVSWNAGAKRLKGYNADEIVGRHFSVFYASKEIAASELKLALSAGAYEKECDHVRKDGTRFWASSLTAPIFDDTGKLRGYSRITRDMTGRKSATAN